MQIEQVIEKANAGEQDTNTYHIEFKDTWHDLQLSFDAVVNMPYQDWLEMHQFWSGHSQRLQEHNGDVIKRVLTSYAYHIANYCMYYQFYSDEGINEMLSQMEGYNTTPRLEIKNVQFDFEIELQVTDFSVKEANDD